MGLYKGDATSIFALLTRRDAPPTCAQGTGRAYHIHMRPRVELMQLRRMAYPSIPLHPIPYSTTRHSGVKS